jgi:hypothetical protein
MFGGASQVDLLISKLHHPTTASAALSMSISLEEPSPSDRRPVSSWHTTDVPPLPPECNEPHARASPQKTQASIFRYLIRCGGHPVTAHFVGVSFDLAHTEEERAYLKRADKHHKSMASTSRNPGPAEQEGWCLPTSSDILELGNRQHPMRRGGTDGTVHRDGRACRGLRTRTLA